MRWDFTQSIYNNSCMFKILLVAFLATVAVTAVTPPMWAETFTQDFVESYQFTRLHVIGKVHYDSKRDMERIDRNDGQFETLCGSVLPNVTTPCTHLARDKKRYIIYPNRRQCCMCCDEAHGCGVTKRDWLHNSTYEGEQTLQGQSFYKWGFNISSFHFTYYDTKTEQRVPRRFIDPSNKKTEDFIMNTYSTEPIASSVFDLPSYCTEACPSTTICGKLRSEPVLEQ